MTDELKDESREMAKIACHALEEKKAEDISVIDIRGISTIADYFVIGSASNTSQIRAVTDEVEKELYMAGYPNVQKEGNSRSTWVLLDYRDIIVHVFSKEDRLFYDLEKIWRDGKFIDYRDL